MVGRRAAQLSHLGLCATPCQQAITETPVAMHPPGHNCTFENPGASRFITDAEVDASEASRVGSPAVGCRIQTICLDRSCYTDGRAGAWGSEARMSPPARETGFKSNQVPFGCELHATVPRRSVMTPDGARERPGSDPYIQLVGRPERPERPSEAFPATCRRVHAPRPHRHAPFRLRRGR